MVSGTGRTAATLLVFAATAVSALPGRAENSDPVVLDAIVVTATRSETGVYESLSGSSAKTRQQIETEYPNAKLPEILTSVPGVTTQTSADDPGVAINLRGLQDFGRVNVLVDGARQNFQKNGHEANGTFYLDPLMMKSVDVTRGPVSSIYGSGAIGGVVSFTTIDADDLLSPDEQVGGRVRTVYDTNGAGPTLHGELAGRLGDTADLLLGATFQQIDDYTSGDGTQVDSAQDMRSGLAKWRYKPDDANQFTLSGSRYTNAFDNGSTVVRESEVTVDTLTGGYRYTPQSDFWDLSLKTYFTSTLFEQYAPNGGPFEQSFDVETVGTDLFNTSSFATGDLNHQLTYGADVFRDEVNTVDVLGSSEDLTPSGERIAYGAYVQDRLRYDTWLEVIGALRYDGYSMENGVISTDGERVSPKITVGVTPWEPMTLYATYAEGYRAPAVTETFIDGFHPPPAVGRFFPNPELLPEVARTHEAGANFRLKDLAKEGDRLGLKVGVFENNVDNYIDQVFIPFPIPGGYQYQNIAEARIRGVEAETSYDSGDFFASASGQYLEGINVTTGDLLQKVPPWRLVATAGVRLFDETLTLGARGTIVGEKVDDVSTGFIGEPYELLDLFAEYKLSDSLTGNLALNNIFDREYTQYLNADPSPGFNARASLTLDF